MAEQVVSEPVSPAIAEAIRPENRADPYSIYRHYRETAPMHRAEPGLWTFTRYRDILAVLRDDRFSADPRNAVVFEQLAQESGEARPIADVGGRVLLFTDPPDHTRLRTLVNKAFTPRTVERLRPRVEALVDELLEDVAARHAMDVIEDLAYPLPAAVICELMGVPSSDRDMFRGWSGDVAPILDPSTDPETLQKAMGTVAQFGLYFWQLIDERTKDPQDDLLSAMVHATVEEDRLDHQELIGLCVLIFIAGHETTQNLIGNGLNALLHNRDQLDLLRSDPSLGKDAVEELLRYDSPVQLTARSAMDDIEIGGTTIPKGEEVIVLLGAGNRDPVVFDDPDALDITRKHTAVASFGGGAHFCLGAGLARLEGQIVFEKLLARFGDGIELVEEPEYRPTMTLRGLKALKVRF